MIGSELLDISFSLKRNIHNCPLIRSPTTTQLNQSKSRSPALITSRTPRMTQRNQRANQIGSLDILPQQTMNNWFDSKSSTLYQHDVDQRGEMGWKIKSRDLKGGSLKALFRFDMLGTAKCQNRGGVLLRISNGSFWNGWLISSYRVRFAFDVRIDNELNGIRNNHRLWLFIVAVAGI